MYYSLKSTPREGRCSGQGRSLLRCFSLKIPCHEHFIDALGSARVAIRLRVGAALLHVDAALELRLHVDLDGLLTAVTGD
jgi:hypothetical protein